MHGKMCCVNQIYPSMKGKLVNIKNKWLVTFLVILLRQLIYHIYLYLMCSSASSDSGEIGELERKNALLRMSIADKKDSDKYAKKMDLQLKEISEQNRKLEARFEAQKDKLAECSKTNVKLVTQLVEYQESNTYLSAENSKIREENADLASQVAQLGDILRERSSEHSTKDKFGRNCTAPSLDDYSINDISMDDPQGIS